ncbi:MAG: hypothetical protein Q9166_005617 [cf. Caloplaca sp. 2 TL-2023]
MTLPNPPPASSTNQPIAPSARSTETLPPSGPRSKLPTPAPAPVPAPVQPGLSLPQDFPPLAASQAPVIAPPKSQKKINVPNTPGSTIKPVVPVMPSQSGKRAGASNAKDGALESSIAKEDLPTIPASTATVEQVWEARSKKEAPPSDTMGPARAKNNGKSSEPAATRVHQAHAESSRQPEEAAVKGQKVPGKRHPGALNIEATKSSSDKAAQSSGQVPGAGPASSTTASAASQPETPGTAVSQTSCTAIAKTGQPRTIRVLPTSTSASKSETPRKGQTAVVPKEATNAVAAQALSRRGSLSSMNPPGTPASERISDNVSLTSTSVSRANSPPPGKIGTAATRHVSKSQQKKERQARAKQAEETAKVDEVPVKAAAEEPVQAPIIGRKKKQKKTVKGGTADSTPAITRPGSPAPYDGNVEQEEPAPMTPIKDGKKDEAKTAGESEVETAFSPAGPPPGIDQPQKNTLNAAALFSALQRSGDISSSTIEIFRSAIGLNHRFDIDAQSLDHMPEVGLPPTLTEAQTQEIERGEPVCVDQGNNKRVIVLPDRRTLRGLTPEQAKRYLELRKQALETSEGLFLAGYGPAPPRPSKIPSANTSSQQQHLPNPFLTEAQTHSSSTNVSRLPQAFGSIASANPTTYVDEAAAFIATRRNNAGSVMGVEEAEKSLLASRRETEALEKRLNGLLKRNKRLVT